MYLFDLPRECWLSPDMTEKLVKTIKATAYHLPPIYLPKNISEEVMQIKAQLHNNKTENGQKQFFH